MTDAAVFDNLVPIVAAHLGLAPSTLLLLVALVHLLAKFGSRIIPNDATGGWAAVRRACSILGVDPSSRITRGVTVQDVAIQSLAPPPDRPVAEKVADQKGVPVSDITPQQRE